MSIEQLMDHQATIYRPTDTTDAYADVASGYAAAGVVPLAIVPPSRRLRDYGAGEQAAGVMEAYLRFDAALQPRDVLSVTSGPEAGTAWRTLAVHRPRGHHTEAVLEPFHGALA